MSETFEIAPPNEDPTPTEASDSLNVDQPARPGDHSSSQTVPGESEEIEVASIDQNQGGSSDPETENSGSETRGQQTILTTTRSSTRRTRPGPGQTFSRVSLGSALLAVDSLNEVFDQIEEIEAQAAAEPRTLDSVLIPAEEWDERFGEGPGITARHIAIGMMLDARSRTNRTLGLVNKIGNVAVLTFQGVLAPLTRSRFVRPLSKMFDSAVERGEEQVGYWKNLGRSEDVRSRRVAETAINIVAEDSMDEVIENERIKKFVQEMMAAQSLGIVDEAIEEIRERGVSSDSFFERPFRRLFNRPPRDDIPGPEFDPRLVRPISKRHLPIVEDTLLGYYAGFNSRMLALVIDIALVLAFVTMTGWLLQTIGSLLGSSQQIESLAITKDVITMLAAAVSALNAVTVVIAYAFIFWSFAGQTPGMMLMGLRIVDKDGVQPSIGRSFLRLLGYIISIAFFFLGFIWVLGDDRRQGWHDKLAHTYVVYAWDARPDETFLTYRMILGG